MGEGAGMAWEPGNLSRQQVRSSVLSASRLGGGGPAGEGGQEEVEAELLGRKASVYHSCLAVEWGQLAAFRNLHDAPLILAFVLACL